MTTLTDEQMERAARELCRLKGLNFPEPYPLAVAKKAVKRRLVEQADHISQAIATTMKKAI